MTEDLAGIRALTLVVATSGDRLVLPSGSAAIAAGVPQAALVELSNGHGSPARPPSTGSI